MHGRKSPVKMAIYIRKLFFAGFGCASDRQQVNLSHE